MLQISSDEQIQAWDVKLREEIIAPNIFDEMYDKEPRPKISIWKRLWWKVKYPFEFRITHKDNIGGEW